MKKFCFGNDYNNSKMINAKNIEVAIAVFNTEVLFPEKYVDDKYIKKDKKGYIIKEYNDITKRYEYEFKDNPKILIYEIGLEDNWHVIKDKKLKPVRILTLKECIDWDYTSIIPKRELIGFDNTTDNKKKSIIKVDNIECKNLASASKSDLRTISDKISNKKYELEEKIDELNEIVNKMGEEIERRLQLVYILETYLGTKEEVYLLASGENADDKEPLNIYQQILYMDEEIGIFENGGIDYEDIDKFDKWITKNYEKFLYKEKSVCVFQVRRNPKHYSDNAYHNAERNRGNFFTYFLIRNGENIYRIWSNVVIRNVVFPKSDEYDNIIKTINDEYKNIINSSISKKEKIKKEIKDFYEKYMYGFIAIQGLIDRTNIFGYRLRNVRLLDGKFTDKEIILIRDAEQEYWISDKPCWKDFINKNRETITKGTRIVISRSFRQYGKYNDICMLSSRRANFPKNKKIYIVEEVDEKAKIDAYGFAHKWRYKIKYISDDKIWNDWDYSVDHTRKNRVTCKLFPNDVINFDNITYGDCEYYEKNRFERKDYLEILPTISWIKNLKKEEEDLENEFKKLLKTRVDKSEKEMNKAIKWWKLKNKWKRGLNKDNKKAFKMIINYLNGNRKYNYGENIYKKSCVNT